MIWISKGWRLFFALFEGESAIPRQHLPRFTSMQNSKGVPNASVTRTLYSWVEDNPSLLLKTMSRLFSGQGMPPMEPLKMYQLRLQRYVEPDDGDDSGSETDDDDMRVSAKLVALYLVNQGSQALSWEDCQNFLNQFPSKLFDYSALDALAFILKGPGGGHRVRTYLSYVNKDKPTNENKLFLLSALIRRIPFEKALFAMASIDEHDRRDYLYYTRDIDQNIDQHHWRALKTTLDTLETVEAFSSRRDLKKSYIELLQRFPVEEQHPFTQADGVSAILDRFPTRQLIKKVIQHSPDKTLADLFRACLDYNTALSHKSTPGFNTVVTLFQVLLSVHTPFYDHPSIPPYTLASTTAVDENSIILNTYGPSGVENPATLLWYFLIAVMDALSDARYDYDPQSHTITVRSWITDHRTDFPVPRLQIEGHGIRVLNWTRTQFLDFCQAVDMPDELYKTPDPLRANAPAHVQNRGIIRSTHTTGAEASENLYSAHFLQTLLRNGAPLNINAWLTADHYKDRLSSHHRERLKALLAEDHSQDIPESLITFLNTWQPKTVTEEEAPTTLPDEPKPLDREALLAAILSNNRVTTADLEELKRYREELTLEQVVNIIQCLPASSGESVFVYWEDLQREKSLEARQGDPLLLGYDDDIWDSVFSDSGYDDFVVHSNLKP